MNKVGWILGSIFLGGLLVTQVFAHGPQGGQKQGNGGHMMGSGMMGSGMMGQGMGHGMMGQDHERQHGSQDRQLQKPLDKKDARALLENYLKSMKNPNLKLGTIKDVGPAFEAEILTIEDSLVDKIVVDKNTGLLRSIY